MALTGSDSIEDMACITGSPGTAGAVDNDGTPSSNFFGMTSPTNYSNHHQPNEHY